LKQHQITYAQETKGLEDALDAQFDAHASALDKQFAVEHAANEKIVALYPRMSAQWVSARDKMLEADQKYFDKVKEEEAKFHADRQKMVDEAATHEAETWTKLADQVSGAFNSQLSKILAGQESFGAALKAMSGQIVLKMIEDQVKLSAQFIAQQAVKLATTVATESGMTEATVAGNALRTAASVAGGEVSIAQTLANALKSIFTSVGQTSAEVSAAVAPVAGPAAPAVGAAAGASTLSTALGFIASADIGGYVVGGGLLNVHQGETVVPANINQPYQGGAGGGGVTINYAPQVSAIDGGSVQSFFRQNVDQIARILSQHMNQNPSYQS
jgi:hypothetical protein